MYKVGDRVKIKDRLCHVPSRLMWKYAGTVMTVRKTITESDGSVWYYLMEEDYGEFMGSGWSWLDKYIAGYADEFETTEALDDSTLPQITFEQMLAGTTPSYQKGGDVH